MLGSHNSYTYLPSTSSFYNRFTNLWRCQNKTIQQQYDAGVRYFDVRVCEEKSNNRTMWRVAHGLVNLQLMYINLTILLKQFSKFKNIYLRIILEKGDATNFKNQIKLLLKKYDFINFVAVKKNWEVIYDKNNLHIIDYTYIPWHSGDTFWQNLSNFKFSSIQKYAKEHNPNLTLEMINDTNTVYFMDYV